MSQRISRPPGQTKVSRSSQGQALTFNPCFAYHHWRLRGRVSATLRLILMKYLRGGFTVRLSFFFSAALAAVVIATPSIADEYQAAIKCMRTKVAPLERLADFELIEDFDKGYVGYAIIAWQKNSPAKQAMLDLENSISKCFVSSGFVEVEGKKGYRVFNTTASSAISTCRLAEHTKLSTENSYRSAFECRPVGCKPEGRCK
jgi:hypothetical protein